ncbi:MAG TPA: PEP/pyruvate-binding domain-containing protein [candidate division Zixibacteria bacterium]|mgnify:CR=1 FL=1|nr:PEP/pyruvate-binding domain-containing protein [candidate division Zixibacteria bacterium]
MNPRGHIPAVHDVPPFDRRFFESDNIVSRIGGGAIGGKASGLVFAHSVLSRHLRDNHFQDILVTVPRSVVIGTDVFDAFMKRNDLYAVALGDMPDDHLANLFQRAEFPSEFAGDLRAIITSVKTPLAVRSSSMLEDSMYEPFAGVYETKMTPNNQTDPSVRYQKLVEAVKFVYASTFFSEARAYAAMTGHDPRDEKMALIVQEVVGNRHNDRFYPSLSGVGRSFNFYAFGHARPEDGVVDLALGLGKTIVDGGLVWTYCPAYPRANPPFTTSDLLKNTQTRFWAVNMGKPPAFDPIHETEYLVESSIDIAEGDNSLTMVASTYQPENDRIVMGTGADGPRLLNFAPILRLDEVPLNDLVQTLLNTFSEELGAAIEMEFALVLDSDQSRPPRFGCLQVRPMVVSDEEVEISAEELEAEYTLLASDRVLGNGTENSLTDVVFVKPEEFSKEQTRTIAEQIGAINRRLVQDHRHYLLIGFGRWGSSDPWLGIPVDWSHVSGARVLVEATLPEMHVELSQGSHFFHNLTSLQLFYFSVSHLSSFRIDWDWLMQQPVVAETEYVCHTRLSQPLHIKVDGRSGRGVISR